MMDDMIDIDKDYIKYPYEEKLQDFEKRYNNQKEFFEREPFRSHFSNVNCWQNGGTGITNFPWEELPVYAMAIDQYKDTQFKIWIYAYNNVYDTTRCSLHYCSGSKELAPFWELVSKLGKQLALQKKQSS